MERFDPASVVQTKYLFFTGKGGGARRPLRAPQPSISQTTVNASCW